jgi:hypothetical protein
MSILYWSISWARLITMLLRQSTLAKGDKGLIEIRLEH